MGERFISYLIQKLRGLLAAVFLLICGAGQVTADQPARFVTLDYDIRLNGILVATVAVDATLGDGTYKLTSRMRTRHLMDLILGFDSRAHAQGRVVNGAVAAEEHGDDNVWMGEERHVQIAYGPGGPVKVHVSPAPADEGRDLVSADMRAGTVDLLSAVLHISLRAARGDVCQSTVKVFDGRRRYDLALSTGKVEDTAIGADIHCAGKLVRLAGRSVESWLPRSHAPHEFQLWLTRIAPDLPPVPSRLRGFTGIGQIVAELASHSRRPRDEPVFLNENGSE